MTLKCSLVQHNKKTQFSVKIFFEGNFLWENISNFLPDVYRSISSKEKHFARAIQMLELENSRLKINKRIKMVFYEYLPGDSLKNFIDKNKEKIS